MAVWVTLMTFRAAYNIVKTKGGAIDMTRLGRSELGMIIAHLGIAVSVVGATMVSNYSLEKSVRMGPGISHELAGYTFNYVETKNVVGPNYTAQQGQIEVYQGDDYVTLLRPDRRQYNVRTMDMTEAGIDWGLFRDLYVTMGDPISRAEYAVRINYKPFVRWIWFGSIFMMVGGFFAASDKRYRAKAVSKVKKATGKLVTA